MRKEINLNEGAIENLQILADKKKWSLKKYMEHILEQNAKKAIPQSFFVPERSRNIKT